MLWIARLGDNRRAVATWAPNGAGSRHPPSPGVRPRFGDSSASWSMTDCARTTRRRPCRARGSSGLLPRILDEAEIQRMFEAAEDRAASGEIAAVRNLALLELLYGSGLRASELVSLPRGSVRSGQPFLMVRGKGDKERLVPISTRADAAVSAWLEHVPSDSLWLFPKRQKASQPGAVVPDRPGDGGRLRNFARTGQPACPSPRICDPLAVGRRGPPRAPVAARPCRHCDDPNLHPRR